MVESLEVGGRSELLACERRDTKEHMFEAREEEYMEASPYLDNIVAGLRMLAIWDNISVPASA